MPHYKPKYLENLDTSVEVELPISLYDFVRTIAEHNKQSMSEVCIEMLGSVQFTEHWFAEYEKGRPYNSRYASRRKKGVKETSEMTQRIEKTLKRLSRFAIFLKSI